MDNSNCPSADLGDDSGIYRRISSHMAVNLQFTDMLYQVEAGEQAAKIILNSVSGEFRAGELSAIIGPSGSGKTTFLNILAGYRIKQNSGKISVNGSLLHDTEFRKMSRYVFQDDHVSPKFSVKETMMMASNFKLKSPRKQRLTKVNELLELFQLQEHADTLMANVSGGERKRVCIALELLNNPAALFLDEPTTGLDESSAFQCVKLLKQLSMAGHTVICSIHSPSYRLMQMFDHVYTLAEGQCIYQGEVAQIVPYLEQFGLKCPTNYNPADFIIEAAMHAYGDYHEVMVQAVDNGKIIKWLPDLADMERLKPYEKTCESCDSYKGDVDVTGLKSDKSHQISWWSEFTWVLYRIIRHIWRDKTNLNLMIFAHIFLATLIGYIYVDVGSNASIGLYNYHLTMLTMILTAYLSISSVLMSISQEIKYLQREHFNQWYRLSSYFMALLTSQLIKFCIMTPTISALLYFISGQPLELFRFALYTLVLFLISLVSSSFGLLIGSRLSLLNSLFFGPNIVGVFLMLANYVTQRPDLSIVEKLIVYASYLRHAMEGILAALFHFNRAKFICPPSEMFCLVVSPRMVLRILASEHIDYLRSVVCLFGFYLLFSVLAFVNLRSRLMSKRISHLQLKYMLMKYLCLRKCCQ